MDVLNLLRILRFPPSKRYNHLRRIDTNSKSIFISWSVRFIYLFIIREKFFLLSFELAKREKKRLKLPRLIVDIQFLFACRGIKLEEKKYICLIIIASIRIKMKFIFSFLFDKDIQNVNFFSQSECHSTFERLLPIIVIIIIPFPLRVREFQYLTVRLRILRRKSSTISLLIFGRGRLQRTPKTVFVVEGGRFIRFWILVWGSRGRRTSTQLDSSVTCVHWSKIDRNGTHSLLSFDLSFYNCIIHPWEEEGEGKF